VRAFIVFTFQPPQLGGNLEEVPKNLSSEPEGPSGRLVAEALRSGPS
jgi:hypothetical protein